MVIRYSIKRGRIFPNLERWIKSNCGNYSEFARRIGLHRATVSAIMNGSANPRWDTILAILDETGMTFEECFGGVRNV